MEHFANIRLGLRMLQRLYGDDQLTWDIIDRVERDTEQLEEDVASSRTEHCYLQNEIVRLQNEIVRLQEEQEAGALKFAAQGYMGEAMHKVPLVKVLRQHLPLSLKETAALADTFLSKRDWFVFENEDGIMCQLTCEQWQALATAINAVTPLCRFRIRLFKHFE